MNEKTLKDYTAGSLPMLKHGFSLTALQNRSFDALRLGSAVDGEVEVDEVKVEVEVADEIIHALLDTLLDTASNDDQLGRTEQEHPRLEDDPFR